MKAREPEDRVAGCSYEREQKPWIAPAMAFLRVALKSHGPGAQDLADATPSSVLANCRHINGQAQIDTDQNTFLDVSAVLVEMSPGSLTLWHWLAELVSSLPK